MAANPPLALPANHKFAILAIVNCDERVPQRVHLAGGTLVLTDVRSALDEQWRAWLGESRSGAVDRANLVLIRHAPSTQPNILDGEHEKLGQETSDIFALLQYSGTPSYSEAILLKGSVERGRLNIRQVGDLREFYRPAGARSVPVTVARLQEAENRMLMWSQIVASGQFKRFIRAANVLMEGLHEYYGEERLHQCVRAMEGLILPDTGRTRRQFIHRCQTFTITNNVHADLLAELFSMRSDVEHIHEWDRSLGNYPVANRLQIAEHRTRQAQALATREFGRILDDPNVRGIFQSDAATAAFWALNDQARKQQWANSIDLTAVP